MIRSIQQNGKLTFPLYHGTGSVFIDQIMSTGLGAKDGMEAFGLRKMAGILVGLSAPFAGKEDWIEDIDGCERAAKAPESQKLKHTTGFNFRYGGAYVTPSRQSAIFYAISNPRGSEALRSILSLHNHLIRIKPEIEGMPDLRILRDLAQFPKTPILIQANDVNIASLRAEQGGPPDDALRWIQETLEETDCDAEYFDMMTQQSNFELACPVPPSQLNSFLIETEPSSDYRPRKVRLAPYHP